MKFNSRNLKVGDSWCVDTPTTAGGTSSVHHPNNEWILLINNIVVCACVSVGGGGETETEITQGRSNLNTQKRNVSNRQSNYINFYLMSLLK